MWLFQDKSGLSTTQQEVTWWVVAVSQPTLPGSIAVLIRVRVRLDQLKPGGSTAMDQSDLAPASMYTNTTSVQQPVNPQNFTQRRNVKSTVYVCLWQCNVSLNNKASQCKGYCTPGETRALYCFPLSSSTVTDGGSVAPGYSNWMNVKWSESATYLFHLF